MPYTNNKDADQPAHPPSLISAFVVRCLDSIIPIITMAEIPMLYLDSIAELAGLRHPVTQPQIQVFLWRGLIEFRPSQN